MENQAPTDKAIAGDLPIRTARRGSRHEGLETSPQQSEGQPGKKVQIEDEVDSLSKPKPKIGKKGTDLDEEISVAIGPRMAKKSQAKSKKRPKSKRGRGKPTGFEEWGAEGPITVDEHAEDVSLYDPSRAFINRLEDALMRFQRKRRLESLRANIFHKFLQYGGITAGPNFGTGVPARELKDMNKEQIMQARNQTLIEKERETLDISFTEVIRGFLGSFYLRYFNPEDEDAIKFTTNTIQNFYTYLLYHDVCPEYNEDILQARAICDLAAKELWKNLQLICQGPGFFNKSCSMLFGGHHFGQDDSTDSWAAPPSPDEIILTRELAQKVVKHAIAGAGSHDAASLFLKLVEENGLTAKRIEDIDGFEVLSTAEPDGDCLDFYHQLANDLTPVGVIKAKSFIDLAKPHVDLSPKERWDWDHGKAPSYEFTFFIETDLLPLFYPGAKVLTSVWEISCGVFYFDETFCVYPTFNNVIANDMMLSWKRPRDLTEDEFESNQTLPPNIRDEVVEKFSTESAELDSEVDDDPKSSKSGNENVIKTEGEEENSASEAT